MAKYSSSQHEANRRRASRVEIVHEVHLPDGTHKQEELPMVVGVIADLSGDADVDRPPLRDSSRDFVRIHQDNFDDVLAGARPRLAYSVDDTLRGQGELRVELNFRRLDDFHPDSVAQQVPEIREQLRTRKLLEEMRNLISSNPRLEEQLEEIIADPVRRGQLLSLMARRRDAGRREED